MESSMKFEILLSKSGPDMVEVFFFQCSPLVLTLLAWSRNLRNKRISIFFLFFLYTTYNGKTKTRITAIDICIQKKGRMGAHCCHLPMEILKSNRTHIASFFYSRGQECSLTKDWFNPSRLIPWSIVLSSWLSPLRTFLYYMKFPVFVA